MVLVDTNLTCSICKTNVLWNYHNNLPFRVHKRLSSLLHIFVWGWLLWITLPDHFKCIWRFFIEIKTIVHYCKFLCHSLIFKEQLLCFESFFFILYYYYLYGPIIITLVARHSMHSKEHIYANFKKNKLSKIVLCYEHFSRFYSSNCCSCSYLFSYPSGIA